MCQADKTIISPLSMSNHISYDLDTMYVFTTKRLEIIKVSFYGRTLKTGF